MFVFLLGNAKKTTRLYVKTLLFLLHMIFKSWEVTELFLTLNFSRLNSEYKTISLKQIVA